MSYMSYSPHIAWLSSPSFSLLSQTNARLSAATLPLHPGSRWKWWTLSPWQPGIFYKKSHIDSQANKYRHKRFRLSYSSLSIWGPLLYFFILLFIQSQWKTAVKFWYLSEDQHCASVDGRNNEGSAGGGASATDVGVLSCGAPSAAANQAALRPPAERRASVLFLR